MESLNAKTAALAAVLAEGHMHPIPIEAVPEPEARKEPQGLTVIVGLPPGYDAINRALPGANRFGVLFSWGTAIYNPSNVPISESLMAHEQVHGDRQLATEGGVVAWWIRYCNDAAFRLAEEIPAHIMELAVVTRGWTTNRRHRTACLSYIAHRLSSALYNKLIPLHKAESLLRHAMKEIAV